VGLPSTAWTRSRTAEALAREHDFTAESIADVRNGDAILRFTAPSAAAFSAALATFDGHVRGTFERSTVLAGAPDLRAAIDAWGAIPSSIETMRAIKAHFDPDGILAPGRYVGAI
jgi:glycolate oxidase FAD binding subunit